MKYNNYSVLMSVYIKEKPEFLEQSILSILSQTVKTNDFVLVCDGELNESLNSVIKRFETENSDIFNVVRLSENLGLGRALNKGMSYCKNELIARMDSDDISLPDRCERQLNIFKSSPETDIVSGTVLEFEGSRDNVLSQKSLPKTNEEIRQYIRQRNPYNHPAVMYKKNAVLNAGGYLDFPLFEDYYLWIRMTEKGAVGYNIGEPLVYMRGGAEMYKRRGGFSYLKKVLKFRTYMYKNDHCGLKDYLKAVIGQSVICIMPLSLRMYLYSRLLRGSEKSE